jgi:sugar-specific transcriptional regulator TrmB
MILKELGFTQSQANLYLAILKLGQADAKTLSKHSEVPRQAIYRTLQELMSKGFVEKLLTTPSEFRSTPINMELSILIKQRQKDYLILEKKAEELFKRSRNSKEISSKKEPVFSVIQGIEAVTRLYRSKHDKAKKRIDVVTHVPRLMQILNYNLENYRKATKRGVKYRVIVDQPLNEDAFLRKVQILLENPNFKLGILPSRYGCTQVDMAVFDGEDSNFNFLPAKMLNESPVVSTNHPSIIAMFESYFETYWKKTKKI